MRVLVVYLPLQSFRIVMTNWQDSWLLLKKQHNRWQLRLREMSWTKCRVRESRIHSFTTPTVILKKSLKFFSFARGSFHLTISHLAPNLKPCSKETVLRVFFFWVLCIYLCVASWKCVRACTRVCVNGSSRELNIRIICFYMWMCNLVTNRSFFRGNFFAVIPYEFLPHNLDVSP